jgi:hypothetical protein
VVILTTDNDKLYRYTGTQWTKAISAADMDDQIAVGQIATNAVTTGTIEAGAISTAKLDAGAVTAATVDVDELFANDAVIGAIQASSITTAAIVSTIGNFEFIESDNIAADAITAGKIDASAIDTRELNANAVTAEKIDVVKLSAISADVGEITAGTINADVIKLDNLTMDTDANNNLVLGGFDAFTHVNANTLGAIEGTGGNNVGMTSTDNLIGSLYVDAAPHHIAKSSSTVADPSVQVGQVMGGTTDNTDGVPLMSYNFTTADFLGTRKFLVNISLDPVGSYGSGSASMFAFAMRATSNANAYKATSASSYVVTEGTSIGGTRSGNLYYLTDVVELLGNTEYYIWVFGQLEDVNDGGHPTVGTGFLFGSIQVAGLSK